MCFQSILDTVGLDTHTKRVGGCVRVIVFMGNVYLKVSVDDKTVVHVLQTQDDFSSVETHFFLAEHTVLRQVVVQIAP